MNFKNPQKYSQNAKMQQLVARDLVAFASKGIETARTILDVGCGTGFVAREICKLFSNKILHGLDPSKEMLTMAQGHYSKLFNAKLEDFEGAKYDVILSSMSLQWVYNIEENINKLAQSGSLYFAIPIEGNLNEIEEAFLKSNIVSPLLQTPKIGIKPEFVNEYKENFNTILELLKSFNSIGAKNLNAKPLTHNQIKSIEQNFNGEITWKIGFFALN